MKEIKKVKLNGSVYDASRETSGLGFWYTFNTPAEPRELPREIYIFQVYGENGSREVIVFDTPFGKPDVRKILASRLEKCINLKNFTNCEACTMLCER